MEYPGKCDLGQVREVLDAINHNCTLRGICETVVRNATEGGFTPYMEVNGVRIEINDYFEASEIHERWTPVVAQIIRDCLTTGYACVKVQPAKDDPDDRIFVINPALYDLRWRTVDYRRVYVAVPSQRQGISSAASSTRNLASRATSMLDNKPIKDTFVHVMYHPDEDTGALTSPLSQTILHAHNVELIMSTYISVICSQSTPPIFTEVTQTASPEADIPYLMNTLEPGTGLNLRKINLPGNAPIAQHLRHAQKVAELNRYGEATAEQLEDLSTTVRTTYAYDGRPVADLTAGRTIAKDPTAPTMEVSAAVEMIQEMLALIGRAYGVSAEYLRGGEGGGSRLIAGVEASRRQLAVMIESLQLPTAKFLQGVFARYYRDLLYEVIEGSRPMRNSSAKLGTRRAPERESPRSRTRSRSRESVAKDASDSAPAQIKKKNIVKSADSLNRITISFNKIPFLDYDTQRKALLDGVMSGNGFRDTIGRMYHIPQSEMTTSYDNGPQELLLDPILEELKTQKTQRRLLDAQLQAQLSMQESGVVPASGGGGAVKNSKPRARTNAESAHERAHGAGVPSVAEGGRVRRQKT